jgi:hypothetical protein
LLAKRATPNEGSLQLRQRGAGLGCRLHLQSDHTDENPLHLGGFVLRRCIEDLFMTAEDEKDYERFLKGIEFFLKLDVKQHMEHIKQHKEDALCTIRHFSGTGSASCTSDGMQGLRSLVQRRVDARGDGKNFAADEVVQCVSDQIGPGLRDGTQRDESPEEIFERVFAQALKSVQDRQKQRTYHFPCVLAGAKSPEQFSIGPVQFTISSLFTSRLLALNPQEKKFSERVQDPELLEYVQKFGWIASVKVPPCSETVSKERAELAARTAINIVRVWFGLGHGGRMRLVHTEPATSGFSRFLVEDDEEISESWSRKFEGASVVDGWFDQIVPGNVHHHRIASWLLTDIVHEERSEMVERLIDALSWFGDAAFEPSPGAKIAKLAILLERLTTTKKFSKKRFCRRVAILALKDDNDFTVKYWAAYNLYNARSEIAHGAKSQFAGDHWSEIRQAQETITNCLFRAMEIYSLFRFAAPGPPRTLDTFLEQQESHWAAVWKSLDVELAKKDRPRGF